MAVRCQLYLCLKSQDKKKNPRLMKPQSSARGIVRLVMVFSPGSTCPNRKVKSGVGKFAERSLGLVMPYRTGTCMILGRREGFRNRGFPVRTCIVAKGWGIGSNSRDGISSLQDGIVNGLVS